ncbi:DUF423 domain-containing protein [Flagellimonas sp.]|uniref:DUF423 domain-containing protein n=1 Tax=Flagellimonas sp. TaxID=2058762 RepID=UPI003BACBA73
MNRTILLTGTVFGLLAIGLGAFGAHGLEKLVDAEAIDTFETGVRYQMYHALFLLLLGMWDGLSSKPKRYIYGLVVAGVVLFSFSIYLLALNSLTAFDFKIIGFLTPIGGVLLILGWILLGYHILTKKTLN